jgi:hypothetical protein
VLAFAPWAARDGYGALAARLYFLPSILGTSALGIERRDE